MHQISRILNSHTMGSRKTQHESDSWSELLYVCETLKGRDIGRKFEKIVVPFEDGSKYAQSIRQISRISNTHDRIQEKKTQCGRKRTVERRARGQDLGGWFLRTNYTPISGMKEGNIDPG